MSHGHHNMTISQADYILIKVENSSVVSHYSLTIVMQLSTHWLMISQKI